MLTGTSNEQKIWNYLKAKGLPDCGIAGLMGNLQAESALRPTNMQNSYESKLGYNDATYTAAVDYGSYTNFAKDECGYGLAQWTYWSRKQNLHEFAKDAGKSIGDLEMQLDFLWKELSEGYKAVLTTLKTATSVLEASNAVLLKFERPANQGSSVQAARAKYGQAYYDKYAGATTGGGTAMSYTAKNLIAIAASEIGYKEKASNASLDDPTANAGANNWTKFGRDLAAAGYYNGNKNGYAWCDVFVDWCFYQLAGKNAAKAQEIECQTGPLGAGCTFSAGYYKAQGRYDKNPKPGDQVFFQQSGDLVHTGIVESVSGNTIRTIEGNSSNQVARRTYSLPNSYVSGFGHPKYEADAVVPVQPVAPVVPDNPSTDVVYTVVRGDALSGIAAKYGTTYQKLAAYNGIANPNVISVGQKIKIPGTAAAPAAPVTPKPIKSVDEIAQEVIAGKWGNGDARKKALEAAGYNYSEVQAAVNAKLAGNKPAEAAQEGKTYTVVRGDSLWKISAQQLGNGARWPEIKSLNGLGSNTIYAGQVLKLPQ